MKMDINRLKDKIIVEVLDYYREKDEKLRQEILDNLLEFAKYYGVIIKKDNIFNKKALRAFILNDEGYNKTIKDLYNLIKWG